MRTTLIVVLLSILGIAGGYYYFEAAEEPKAVAPMDVSDTSATSDSMMRAEENMVVVMEQKPGNSVIGMAHLAAPGYLVIHEDVNGEPGAIIGVSALLQAGDTDNITIGLSRPTKNGDMLHAMLHFEKGGNATFSAAEDTPVPSALGGPISGWFHIADDASDVVPVTL